MNRNATTTLWQQAVGEYLKRLDDKLIPSLRQQIETLALRVETLENNAPEPPQPDLHALALNVHNLKTHILPRMLLRIAQLEHRTQQTDPDAQPQPTTITPATS